MFCQRLSGCVATQFLQFPPDFVEEAHKSFDECSARCQIPSRARNHVCARSGAKTQLCRCCVRLFEEWNFKCSEAILRVHQAGGKVIAEYASTVQVFGVDLRQRSNVCSTLCSSRVHGRSVLQKDRVRRAFTVYGFTGFPLAGAVWAWFDEPNLRPIS